MKILPAKEIQKFTDDYKKLIDDFLEKYPITKETVPGWLCIDLMRTDQLNYIKQIIKDTVDASVFPQAIQHNFESLLDELRKNQEKEEKSDETTSNIS